jgi:hypothetical protein
MRDDSSTDPTGTRRPQAPQAFQTPPSTPAPARDPATARSEQFPATAQSEQAAATARSEQFAATGRSEQAAQDPAAPQQDPAAPQQDPAAPQQGPATPWQDPAALRQDQTAPRQDPATARQEQAAARQEQRVEGDRDPAIWDTAKADEFRHRWHEVQTCFVEDPHGSVTEARQLVDEAVQALSASVHDREEQLERAGARSSDSTEGMRDTVLQYHQLLDRLLRV